MKAFTSIIVLLALAATLAGCGVGEASASDAEAVQAATPVPVEVAQPYRANVRATYAATATITSDSDAPAVARVSGVVVELLVEEGEIVTEGQVLARLDGERLRLEMLAAKATAASVASSLFLSFGNIIGFPGLLLSASARTLISTRYHGRWQALATAISRANCGVFFHRAGGFPAICPNSWRRTGSHYRQNRRPGGADRRCRHCRQK